MMTPTISEPILTPVVIPTELAHAGLALEVGVELAVLVGHVKVLTVVVVVEQAVLIVIVVG